MAHAKTHAPRLPVLEALPEGRQVVLDAATASSSPVPDLAALEQIGGPELDGKLELPTRDLWSTRFSPDLFED